MARLASALGLSPVIAWVLLNRGIADAKTAKDFLNPDLMQLKPDELMADMDKAVARIARALEKKETIGIHGDYDVDGITGTALLHRFLRALGASVVWHLPHRQREGYGMKPEGVEALYKEGATLIIAVDCGVKDHEAIGRANELGADVIVADHHQVPETLPPALAVLNHNRPDCPFNGTDISGAGVAFYLAAALRAHLREKGKLEDDKVPNLKSYLDLVALGTVADVVPITGLNRVLVHFGLDQINKNLRPGIVQLKRVSGLGEKEVGVGQIGFQLAPRLNAAGRLDSAKPALELLLADNEREAGFIADELEECNQTRRKVEEQILGEAMNQIESSPGLSEAPAIVVCGQGWHMGVIGIVASRITEAFYRPAAVIGIHDHMGRGSLRSVPGINIFTALDSCGHLLERFGGHTMAAGMTISEGNVASFRKALAEAVAEQAPDYEYVPKLSVDAEWPIYKCDRELVNDMAALRPHGIRNPEPCFCARGVVVKFAREARSNTLLMELAEKDTVMSAVGFRMAERMPEIGERLDIVYTPILDVWKGEERLKLRIKDFKVLG